MKRVATTVMLAICCVAVSIQSAAAQEAEVRAAMEESLAAWRAADFQRLGSFYSTQTRGFMFDGTFLITGFSAPMLEAAVASGVSFDVEPRDIDIVMIGDIAAASVAIIEGTITLPGGAVQEGPWRYSETRVKEDGIWKVVQYHFSPLTMAIP